MRLMMVAAVAFAAMFVTLTIGSEAFAGSKTVTHTRTVTRSNDVDIKPSVGAVAAVQESGPQFVLISHRARRLFPVQVNNQVAASRQTAAASAPCECGCMSPGCNCGKSAASRKAAQAPLSD